MTMTTLPLDQLKPAPINVRKTGGKQIDDLVPSIRSLGLLQPLLVRPNCEPTRGGGFEIVAGQRRYHALVKLADEGYADPVPCIVMEETDDATAIEASLAENLARLPMDEIDQYKAFAALAKKGSSIADIASQFGVTERLVRQRLAIANIHGPILTAYRKDEIGADTVRTLTMASKKQQKEWWALFNDEHTHHQAPQGYRLKDWLFGGSTIPVENALFDLESYNGAIIADLFGEDQSFDNADAFWALQNAAIAQRQEAYLAGGWSKVIVLDVGDYWSNWQHVKTAKEDGGKVFIQVARDGEVTFHEGYITEKDAKRRDASKKGEDKASKPELTKAMQNYITLHKHSVVRAELLSHQGLALRIAVAQIIAGSDLWSVSADPQKANSEAIARSLADNAAQERFAEEREIVKGLLDLDGDDTDTLVPRRQDWGSDHDLETIFAKLIILDDEGVQRILTFVIAESLPSGSALTETLGVQMGTDMASHWSPDATFFDLLRDKRAINAMVKEVAGKVTADANLTSSAKVQKSIIRQHLDGTRQPSKPDWQPRYMAFPVTGYAERGDLEVID